MGLGEKERNLHQIGIIHVGPLSLLLPVDSTFELAKNELASSDNFWIITWTAQHDLSAHHSAHVPSYYLCGAQFLLFLILWITEMNTNTHTHKITKIKMNGFPDKRLAGGVSGFRVTPLKIETLKLLSRERAFELRKQCVHKRLCVLFN